jgi:ABC-type lipoprotein release transport system permease subunit
VIRDLRYAARLLRRSFGLTLLSIVTMGLGIGISATLFTLIRGLDRREETSVRLALGASPARLLREFLLESALLALGGGLAGAAIAAAPSAGVEPYERGATGRSVGGHPRH